jgi:hypothetical protein
MMAKQKLKNSIEVINFDNCSKVVRRRHVEMFPDILRCGIFGPSGVGKSNLLLTMLVHIRPFKNVYLCSKTDYQEKYQTLKELVQTHNKSKKTKKTMINFHNLQVDTLPEPEEIEPGSVIIFDDVLTEKQDKIANFYLRGRHREISCFYLSQTYTKIPKKSGIRENFNYMILFRQDLVNLRQIFSEYVTDLTFEKFRSICNDCWREPYSFLVIDVDNEKCKYKKRFDFCIYS